MLLIKKYWIYFVLLLVIAALLIRSGCSTPKPNNTEPVVVTKIDTVVSQVVQPPVFVPMYIPSAPTTQQVPIYIPQQYQGSEDIKILKQQYQDLVNKFLTEKTYQDSVVLRDSSGNRVGVFNNKDIVKENEIKSRQPSYQLSFPKTLITNTTTITNPYVPNRQLYIGGELTGTVKTPLNGVNLGLMYKDRQDRAYLLKGGLLNYNGEITPSFGAGLLWKIKIKK